MQVQQQFLMGRPEAEGTFSFSTVAYDGDLLHARENEILCREWMAFAPDAFGQSLVHLPLDDPGEDRTRAHLVALATARDGGVAVHLTRLDPEAYAWLGDDPFRLWRQGVLRSDWDDTTPFAPVEPATIADNLTVGLRAIFPEQYTVLEALLCRVVAGKDFTLGSPQDDPAIEDLLEQLAHLTPRVVRRRQTFSTFASGSARSFALSAAAQDDVSLRSELRALLAAPAPSLDPALQSYVDSMFEHLRAKDFDGARALADGFGRTAGSEPEVTAEVEAVASLVDDVVVRIHEPGEVNEADRTVEVIDDVGSEAEAPIQEAAAASAEVYEFGNAMAADDPADASEAAAAWSEGILDEETPKPRRRAGFVAALVVLLLATGAYGLVHFGVIDLGSPAATTEVTTDWLAVGPRADLASFLDAQETAIRDQRATSTPIFEQRQSLSAHRFDFESDVRSTLTAEKSALDARIASVLATSSTDTSVAATLRTTARSIEALVPRLRRLHDAIASGRPEILASGTDAPSRSTLADGVDVWVRSLDAWADRFDAFAAGDVMAALPETGAVTPGLMALRDLHGALEEEWQLTDDGARRVEVMAAASVATERAEPVIAVWGALPFALRELVQVGPEPEDDPDAPVEAPPTFR